MTVRVLSSGDKPTAEQACRLSGLEGELDTSIFLARPEEFLCVTEDGGPVVGWVYGHELIHPNGERTMLLYVLDVAEGARKQGHGSALVDAFVHRARDRSCTEVWVLTDDANPAGLATYAAAGGRRDPLPQVMFSWKLTDGRHS